jgi:hypothetical protein
MDRVFKFATIKRVFKEADVTLKKTVESCKKQHVDTSSFNFKNIKNKTTFEF